MKHPRRSGFVLFTVIAFALAGCERGGSSGRSTAGSDNFRVAIVVPGSTADGGWNYSAQQAVEYLVTELGIPEVSFIENLEASRRKAVLRDYGRDGYNLVICHGYEFNQVVREIADEFPKTTFIISGYDQPDERFGSIVYQLGEAAYLCGVMAAKITQTGHAGFIAAQQVPPVELCYRGFRNGFLAQKPDGHMREPVYIDGARPWEDSAAAKDKTAALLRVREPAPIDVLFQNADAASRGIFEAVEAHPERIFVFGANRDQNDTNATRKVVASAVIHVDRAFLKVAQAVRAGTYKPHVESETLATGVIDLVPSPRLAELVGEDVAQQCLAAVAEAREAIVAGRIDPYGK